MQLAKEFFLDVLAGVVYMSPLYMTGYCFFTRKVKLRHLLLIDGWIFLMLLGIGAFDGFAENICICLAITAFTILFFGALEIFCGKKLEAWRKAAKHKKDSD